MKKEEKKKQKQKTVMQSVADWLAKTPSATYITRSSEKLIMIERVSIPTTPLEE